MFDDGLFGYGLLEYGLFGSHEVDELPGHHDDEIVPGGGYFSGATPYLKDRLDSTPYDFAAEEDDIMAVIAIFMECIA